MLLRRTTMLHTTCTTHAAGFCIAAVFARISFAPGTAAIGCMQQVPSMQDIVWVRPRTADNTWLSYSREGGKMVVSSSLESLGRVTNLASFFGKRWSWYRLCCGLH